MKSMRRIVSAVLLVMMISSVSYADEWRGRHERGHGDAGVAIAAGILGGLAAGVILDRVLTPSPPSPTYGPSYYPPPPASDPYDTGYSDGYGQGVERGRYERYDQGRHRGYDDGYEDARTGRVY